VVTPGSYFGAAGEGFMRMALVPPLADCERAVSLLEALLGEAGPGGRFPSGYSPGGRNP